MVLIEHTTSQLAEHIFVLIVYPVCNVIF